MGESADAVRGVATGSRPGSSRSCRTSSARRSRRSISGPRCCASHGDISARSGTRSSRPSRRRPSACTAWSRTCWRSPATTRAPTRCRSAPLLLQHWLLERRRARGPRRAAGSACVPRSRRTCRRCIADEAALAQVVRNLLRNAARYAGDGMPVEVVAHRPDRRDRSSLEVLDRGPGFAPRGGPRLFEPVLPLRRGRGARVRRGPRARRGAAR